MGCSSSRAVVAPAPAAAAAREDYLDLLFDAYGKPTEQVGYTDGHYCLTNSDREEATRCGSSLLYGEVLPAGVTKLLDAQHLHAAKAQVLYDLGMGTGKLCMQAFLQHESLRLVFGIELAHSRYVIAEEAVMRLVSIQPTRFEVEAKQAGQFIRIHTIGQRKRRVLELRRGNLWTARGINTVDVVILHTELTMSAISKFQRLVHETKRGARFVTYQDLSRHWTGSKPPFRQIVANIDEEDQFATSWSAVKGHHLFCWEKTEAGSSRRVVELEESKECISPLG